MSLSWIISALVRPLNRKLSSTTRDKLKQRLRRPLVEGLEIRQVMAVNPLLIDFDATPFSSTPQNFVEVNGTVYFQASVRNQGAELWKTDGTTAGTQLVKDIAPGIYGSSYPSQLTNVTGTLYFTASDPLTGQSELFKSDGTEAGTVMVDGAVGSVAPGSLTDVNGTLFFTAQRQGNNFNGRELWKSDGTAAGTVLVKDIVRGSTSSNPTELTNVGGTLFFVATTPTTGMEVWKSNGTAAGTVQVRDIVAGIGNSYPTQLINSGGTLFFRASNAANGTELWKSNGTSAGTVIVRDIVAGFGSSYPTYLTDVNGTVYFSVNSELWKSNGTAAGTVPVETLPGGSSAPQYLTNVNGLLFFAASGNSAGQELWKTDGTSAGTVLVKDINVIGYSSNPQQLQNLGSVLYFTADAADGSGRELYKSDGTSVGTALVKDLTPGINDSSSPASLIAVGGRMVFVATDPTVGREIWSTDGTLAGTTLTKDINNSTSGGEPNLSVVVGSTLYFSARSVDGGVELWKSDGTVAGTSQVKDIMPGTSSSYPSNLINANGTLYFVANGGIGRELWKSNGTSAGTVMVANLNGNYSSDPQELVNIGSTLYFTSVDNASGRELWRSGGTVASTTLVKDINTATYTGSNPTKLVAIGSTLYFTADDGVSGREVWKSNGTAAGTVIVLDIASSTNSSYPNELTAVGSTLYFTATNVFNGREVWKSNGTPAGTVMVRDIRTDSYVSSYPNQLTNVNGVLYFSAAEIDSNTYELFKSGGTSGTTVVVEGTESLNNNPTGLTNVNGTLFFVAFEELNNSGRELWKSDGTLAGTSLVKDIVPGLGDAAISQLFNANGSLVFTTDLPNVGRELWKSNGTAAGTQSIVDLWPGALSSAPSNFAMLDSRLTFTADDGASGIELFVLSANQAPSNSLPIGPVNLNEDTPSAISGIAISDVDSDIANIQVSLSVLSGSLNLSASVVGGISASQVLGNGSSSLTIIAPKSAINATLADANGLIYTPVLDASGSVTLSVVTDDLGNIGLGTPLSATSSLTINVTPVNDAPIATFNATTISYTENATPTLLDSTTTLGDIDSLDFDTGLVNVALSSVDTNDRLTVRDEGNAVDQIGVVGSAVSFGGVAIGSIDAGVGGGSLQISLNANASVAGVQALLRNLQFEVLGDTPAVAPRSLVVTVSDGDGDSTSPSTITVNVTAVNDAPVVSLASGPIVYSENSASQTLDGTATLSDIENNLAGATLTATIVSGADANDVIALANQGFAEGQIGLAGNLVLLGTATGPIAIGSISGGSGATPLQVAFNSSATTAIVETVIRALTFRTNSDTPSVIDRIVSVQVADGAAASSIAASLTVSITAINDAPVLDQLGAVISYTEDVTQLIIAPALTVADVDSLDFASGVLTVSIPVNGTTNDVLSVRSQGSGVGQIGVSGTVIRYGGVQIGTLAGGTWPTALSVTLNSSATPVAVQALARKISFRNTSNAPSELPRTVQFDLSDGDGGSSVPATMTLNVIPVNDRAVVGGVVASNTFIENALPLLIAPAGTVTDSDSLNFSGGNLTVRYLAGGTTSDRLFIRNEGFGTGQIGLAGNSVLFGGQTIGTLNANAGIGTTALQIFFNINATPARTQALLRNITFANISDAPATAPRSIQFLLNDGDGGTSNSVTQAMSVTAVNDAPVITTPGTVATYVQSGLAVVVDSAATVTDADSANFAGGLLTVAIQTNASASDVLEIVNQGVAAGQIGVSGTNVTFGGVTIGSFTGGTSVAPLTISLNASATPAAVQALMRQITFRVTGTGISTLTRSLAFQVTDGSAASLVVVKNVNVSL